MNKALYPGSFDPVTVGHLDIIERISKQMDHVFIGIINNKNKKSLFTLKERKELMETSIAKFPNVTVVTFDGLSVNCARELGATALIRGLRVISDFEYELQLAATNRRLAPEVETLFLMARTEYSYISSSIVKELYAYNADIDFYVPSHVVTALMRKKLIEEEVK